MNKLGQLKLSTKLIIGFSVILGVSIAVNIFAIVRLGAVQDVAFEISGSWMPSIYTISDINTNTSDFMIKQQQHIFALSEVEMAGYEREMADKRALNAEYQKKYDELLSARENSGVNDEGFKSNKALFETFKDIYQRYMIENDQIIEQSRMNNKEEAKMKMREKSFALFEECSQILTQLTQDNLQSGRAAAKESKDIYEEARLWITGSSITSIIISILVAILIFRDLQNQIGGEPSEIAEVTQRVSEGDLSMRFDQYGTGIYASMRSMVETLQEIAELANNIAKGDLAKRVRVRSEKDLLAISINLMIDNFKNIISQAKVIAQGDYSINIETRGDSDELGAALQLMTESLKNNKTETEEQNWIKDGINRLGQELSGNLTLNELSHKAISFLSRYTHSGQGVLYIFDSDEEILKLYGAYAYTERNSLSNKYKIGESVIGQVALERSPILLKNIRRGEQYVTSGLIDEPPLNSYTLPLIFENELYGVIELSSFEEVTMLKREFLEQAGRNVATYIYSVQQTDKIKGLLAISEEAQRSAETRAKEIEEVNEQLEEQRKQLQSQSAELQQRNESLISAKEELDRKAEQLELSNKYKSEFLANMSHELRTPLNSIIMLSKMLSKNDQENLSEKDIKKSKIIHKSGEELLRLINDILDLSKIEAGKMIIHPQQFDSGAIMSDMSDLFHSLALEKEKVDFVLEDNYKGKLFTDKERLQQVIRNFLSNSFKFTKKGSITLRVSPRDDKNVIFSVIDTGIGIAPQKQQVIFEAFKQADGTTSREYGGTGLGLSIARELTRLLQGKIELSSKVNFGSSFSIVIPKEINEQLIEEDSYRVMVTIKDPDTNKVIKSERISTPTEVVAEMKATSQKKEKNGTSSDNEDMQKAMSKVREVPRSTSYQGRVDKLPEDVEDDRNNVREGDKVILIIEDEVQFAESMAEVIRNEKQKIVIAQSGKEGLHFAKVFRPNGIILDLGLPDMDGVDVLRELKSIKELRHIPIEIISARDKDLSLMSKGAIGFLQKPVDEHLLRNAMNELVNFSEKRIKDLLIVEDDYTQMEALKELLEADDINVKGVHTQEDAIKELQREIYDGAIVDLGLREGNGYEICTYISEYYPKVPVIIYTGRTLSEEEEKKLRKAAQSIILKTRDAEEKLRDEVALFLHRMEKEVDKDSFKIPEIRKESRRESENKNRKALEEDIRITRPNQDEDSGEYIDAEDIPFDEASEEEKQKRLAFAEKIAQAEQEAKLKNRKPGVEDSLKISEEEAAELIKNKNILVVDDDIRNIFVIASALENFEANIMEAMNGIEAIEALEAESVDLVLMDAVMPEMNGLDAIMKIREHDREDLKSIPIIAITGKAQEEDREECMAAGANAYIVKPVDYDQLLRTVCYWIDAKNKKK